MKKSILFTTVILISLGLNVLADSNPACYLKTGEKVYFGQKLKIGLISTKIISDDGTVIKVPNKNVKSYMDGTRLFELLPVVGVNYDTTGFALMEFVTSRNRLKLYSYYNQKVDPSIKEFYVFKDDMLFLKLNQTNTASVLSFFGIEAR
jgi:hypothetical protein